ASTYRSIGPFRRLTHILGLGLSTSSRCGFMHRYVCLTTGCCENSLSISRNPVDLRPRRARGPEERPPEGAYVLKEGNVDEHGTVAAPVHGRRQGGSRGHDTWSARLRRGRDGHRRSDPALQAREHDRDAQHMSVLLGGVRHHHVLEGRPEEGGEGRHRPYRG